MVVHLRKISNTKRVVQQSPLGKTNGLCTIRQGDEWSTQNTWRGASSWFICCCACGIYATIFQRKGRRPYVSLSGFATVCWEIPDVEAHAANGSCRHILAVCLVPYSTEQEGVDGYPIVGREFYVANVHAVKKKMPPHLKGNAHLSGGENA